MSVPLRFDVALAQATAALGDAGLENPRFEARVLAAGVLGLSREQMIADPGRALDEDAGARLVDAVHRRAAREPTARILGVREFWSLEFALGPDTLVPRPESETVVEAALAAVAGRGGTLSILDLGTGSGCLIAALLVELTEATGIGVDISQSALAVAAANARRLGVDSRVRFICADWGKGLSGAFDLIVANPPYVAEAERDLLAPEVARHDPDRALFAGPDGLDAYRALAPDLARLLTPEGVAVLEIGAGQASPVTKILAGGGLAVRDQCSDLAGHVRALVLKLAASGGLGKLRKKKVGKEDVPV
jgi:release factor glutamine methyltransferase